VQRGEHSIHFTVDEPARRGVVFRQRVVTPISHLVRCSERDVGLNAVDLDGHGAHEIERGGARKHGRPLLEGFDVEHAG